VRQYRGNLGKAKCQRGDQEKKTGQRGNWDNVQGACLATGQKVGARRRNAIWLKRWNVARIKEEKIANRTKVREARGKQIITQLSKKDRGTRNRTWSRDPKNARHQHPQDAAERSFYSITKMCPSAHRQEFQ
jgi:hypothetical protein